MLNIVTGPSKDNKRINVTVRNMEDVFTTFVVNMDKGPVIASHINGVNKAIRKMGMTDAVLSRPSSWAHDQNGHLHYWFV